MHILIPLAVQIPVARVYEVVDTELEMFRCDYGRVGKHYQPNNEVRDQTKLHDLPRF